MLRSVILPLVIIAAAIGIVFMYTMPAYEGVEKRKEQEERVTKTLNNASSIVSLIEELKIQYDSFPSETLRKLHRMLPDVAEPIDVIVEVNQIAESSVILTDAQAENESLAINNSSDAAFTPKSFRTIKATYNVSSGYENILSFLSDLELGLRLTDINRMEFSVDENTGLIDVALDTNTYWLNE